MPTSFRASVTIGAPPDDVLAVLADPAFYPALGELPAITAPEVLLHAAEHGTTRLRVRYRFAADLPLAARRVVDPDRLLWVDDTVIDHASLSARFTIVPEHYGDRFSCAGAWRLTPDGPGTTQSVEGDVRVGIPVLGRLAERGIVRGLTENLEQEGALIERWLAR